MHRLFILDVHTTEWCFVGDGFVDVQTNTDGFEFVVLVPILLRVIVLINHTMCKFMDEDMENFIHFTVDAQTNLSTLVEIVADCTTKSVVGSDGDTVYEFLKLCTVDIVSQNFVAFPDDS